MSRPYTWTATTISDIEKKPEYMGHTVNFRNRTKSYKDKKSTNLILIYAPNIFLISTKPFYLMLPPPSGISHHQVWQ